ncbi:MAG: ester cyclase [Planctomycetaceae bacterium]|nr:ester cyclase [Planctomycetaceae bacterium]
MSLSNLKTIELANRTLIIDGKLDRVAGYFTTDYVAHVTGRDFTGGHKLVKKLVREYRRAFLEIEILIEVLVKAKNRISWQRTLKARQAGPFKCFPASSRQIVWCDMVTTGFRDGLIAEDWVITDLAEQLLLARK